MVKEATGDVILQNLKSWLVLTGREFLLGSTLRSFKNLDNYERRSGLDITSSSTLLNSSNSYIETFQIHHLIVSFQNHLFISNPFQRLFEDVKNPINLLTLELPLFETVLILCVVPPTCGWYGRRIHTNYQITQGRQTNHLQPTQQKNKMIGLIFAKIAIVVCWIFLRYLPLSVSESFIVTEIAIASTKLYKSQWNQ